MKSGKEAPKLTSAEDMLELAISAEMDAHQFYLRAADRVKDPKGRAAFLALAGDEEGHRLQLQGEYHHLRKKGTFRYRPGSNILHRHLKKEMDDVGAIALGIKAEGEAIAFYKEAGKKMKNPELKRILMALVEFEEGHRKLLESEFRARLGRPWEDSELDLWVRE